MKPVARAVLLVAASAASFAGLAQEVAGRLVVSAGDVFIMRGVERIPATFGTQIRAGDQLELGQRSNAQVLFTDQSVVALRSETSFKVEQYEFQGKPAQEQKTLFSLLKGGMRTVTGLIGRVNHDNYAVKTPTATVGIRGTNYTLVQCDGNCRNPNGTAAPGGTYGAVTDGRIGVTNQTGERQFGSDQYFHVASQTSAPTQLIAPPQFLRDTLEGRARAKERQQERAQARAQAQQQQESSNGSSASSGTVASADDSRVSSTVTSSSVPVTLTTNVYQSTASASVTGPASIIIPGANSTVFYHLDSLSGPLNIPVTTCGSPPCSAITAGSFTLGVNLALQRAYLKSVFTAGSNQFALGTPSTSGGIPITVSNGQITFSQTFNFTDFPTQKGSFACLNCGSGTGVSHLDSMSISGVINGTQASLNFAGTDSGGGGSFSTVLTQQTPPNSLAATTVVTNFSGIGATAFSDAYWGVAVNAAGQVTRIGIPGVGSNNVVQIGSATNTTHVSFTLPDGTSVIGGAWTGPGSETITDANFTTGSSTQVVPWIVGSLTNTLPAQLGTSVTYTPVASVVNPGGSGVFNSGSLTADFVNRNVSISLNATNPAVGTFQMNGTSGISGTSARFGSGFSSVTCTGGPCTGANAIGGAFAGFFAGANAEGAGVSFHSGFGNTGVIGVVGFKR
jgi:hypothetical protein